MERKIQRALISVFHKDGIQPIVHHLHEHGVEILSTGGTQKAIEAMGIPVTSVESITGAAEMLGGRVKTLHPVVFGGILSRRGHDGDDVDLKEHGIGPLDLVIVDLYPFEETLADPGASTAAIIEKIDIGGIALIRAAAKNHADVVVIPSRDQYADLLDQLCTGTTTDLDFRRRMAGEAFGISSHYDSAIGAWMRDGDELHIDVRQSRSLRYGENPHQAGQFFGDLDGIFEQRAGKSLSYNNLLDVEAAVALMAEYREAEPTFAVLKHNNACGLATRDSISEAFTDALAGDPVSAFGGVLIANRPVDLLTAQAVHKLFYEVLIAPAFTPEAESLLMQKTKRVLLVQKAWPKSDRIVRTALGGFLVQAPDHKMEQPAEFELHTDEAATPAQLTDLGFALKLVKHTRSNTIVLAKGGQLLASGTGQTSRVDALNQAIDKAGRMGFDLRGAVMASDAFFPFPDCVEIAHKAGIASVVQPGGSVKDQLSIDYCNTHAVSMYFTGFRHFKH
jgi:phosphoribosylaminoimidazolecarboxamide formyltransferase/IMP cyclohydrolase